MVTNGCRASDAESGATLRRLIEKDLLAPVRLDLADGENGIVWAGFPRQRDRGVGVIVATASAD